MVASKTYYAHVYKLWTRPRYTQTHVFDERSRDAVRVARARHFIIANATGLQPAVEKLPDMSPGKVIDGGCMFLFFGSRWTCAAISRLLRAFFSYASHELPGGDTRPARPPVVARVIRRAERAELDADPSIACRAAAPVHCCTYRRRRGSKGILFPTPNRGIFDVPAVARCRLQRLQSRGRWEMHSELGMELAGAARGE